MHEVIDGAWLLSRHGESLEIVELKGERAFKTSKVLPEISAALNGTSEDRNKLVTHFKIVTDPSPQLQITKKTPSGLELKPVVQPLEIAQTTIGSAVSDLVNELHEITGQLSACKTELESTQSAMEEMVTDKQNLQDTVLQKVCAVLDERNLWIDKFKTMSEAKEEIK